MDNDLEGSEGGVGATIELCRAPSRKWPAFPTVALIRAVSRLGSGRRQDPVIGGVSVFLDGSNVGGILPKQIKVFEVSPGDHSLSVHFLGGLRRSKKLAVSLTTGEEKRFVCFLNAIGWPSIRPAAPEDVAAMEGWRTPPSDAPAPA